MSGATARTRRPAPDEYGAYYGGYVSLVGAGDIVEILSRQREETLAHWRAIPEARGGHRYAPGKWSIKEVLGHVVDTERILGTRALAIARGDTTPLPGFEQDDYVARGGFDARSVASLTEELEALRRSHLVLFASFAEEVWLRRGTASGAPFTPRALAWVMAGHLLHHAGVLEERYR